MARAFRSRPMSLSAPALLAVTRPARAWLAVLLLAIPLLAPGAHAAWSGQSADIVISYDDGNSAEAAEIVCDPSDMLHAFWTEGAPVVPELHYGSSWDPGTAWSSANADRVISFPDGNAVVPGCAVACSRGGIPELVAVVWSEFDQSAREIHWGVTANGGATWSSASADRVISNPASTADAGRPSIAADLDGGFHVVWSEMTPGGTAEIHYGRSLDGGLTWSSSAMDRVISFPDGHDALDPKITFCETRLIAVWRELDAAGQMRIHTGTSANLGTTWTSETGDRTISPAAIDITDLAISSTPYSGEEGIYVAYRAAQDAGAPDHYEIYATYSTNLGTTWSGETALICVSHDDGEALSASHPAVFVRPFMGIFAVWDELDEASGTREEHFSWGGGGSWAGASTDSIVSFPDGHDGCCPSITGGEWVMARDDRSGMPICWAAWTEAVGGNPDHTEVHLSALDLGGSGSVEEGPFGHAGLRCIPNPSRDGVRIELESRVPGIATLEILDPQGRLVRSLGMRLVPAGSMTFQWDGRGASGQYATPGLYLLRVRQADRMQTLWITRF
jgi:hypothetical protein